MAAIGDGPQQLLVAEMLEDAASQQQENPLPPITELTAQLELLRGPFLGVKSKERFLRYVLGKDERPPLQELQRAAADESVQDDNVESASELAVGAECRRLIEEISVKAREVVGKHEQLEACRARRLEASSKLASADISASFLQDEDAANQEIQRLEAELASLEAAETGLQEQERELHAAVEEAENDAIKAEAKAAEVSVAAKADADARREREAVESRRQRLEEIDSWTREVSVALERVSGVTMGNFTQDSCCVSFRDPKGDPYSLEISFVPETAQLAGGRLTVCRDDGAEAPEELTPPISIEDLVTAAVETGSVSFLLREVRARLSDHTKLTEELRALRRIFPVSVDREIPAGVVATLSLPVDYPRVAAEVLTLDTFAGWTAADMHCYVQERRSVDDKAVHTLTDVAQNLSDWLEARRASGKGGDSTTPGGGPHANKAVERIFGNK